MEAQAAGTLPIATKLAALAETVRHGILVAPPNSESRYEQEFLGHVRDFLEGRQAAITDQVIAAGREWALRSLSWTAVAGQWEELFEERLKKK
jgi:glycosyltransferase involved in cell wall biosynthesis